MKREEEMTDKYGAAIWSDEINHARKRVKSGDTIKTLTEDIFGKDRIVRIRIAAFYKNLILLDNGKSLTNYDLVMYLRSGRRAIRL